MEEEREGKLNNWLLVILNIVIISIVAICMSLILLVDKVYAITLTPTAMVCSWNTDANTIRNENCFNGADYNIGSYTNYVNFLPTFNSSEGVQLWTISFNLDMYVVDYGNEGDYIVTPKFAFYQNNQLQNIQNLAGTIVTQRADCSNQAGCMLIRTFNYTFQWQGDINGVTIQNLSSYYNRGDCGWLQGNPSTCQASYPRIHYLSMSASYSNNSTEAIQNQTDVINANSNMNTDRIIDNELNIHNDNQAQEERRKDEIIANQNANNQALQENIDSQFNVCENYNFQNNLPIKDSGKTLNDLGTLVNNSNYSVTDYIAVNKNKNYTLTTNYLYNTPYYCLYGTDKTLINCVNMDSQNFTITPLTDGFIRITIRNNSWATTNFTGEYCYNRLDGNTSANESMYDSTKQEEYLETEQELLDLYNTDQLDIIDLTINTDGSNWVWDRITQFLNTNQYIRLMFISILSLGIIKLVLAR